MDEKIRKRIRLLKKGYGDLILSANDVLNTIDNDEQLKKYFTDQVIDIVKDELKHSKLTDFIDVNDNFVLIYPLSKLLDRIS